MLSKVAVGIDNFPSPMLALLGKFFIERKHACADEQCDQSDNVLKQEYNDSHADDYPVTPTLDQTEFGN
jgi:hypothetical protein